MALIGCAIFTFVKINAAAATTSTSEVTGTLPAQNKNIDDRVRLIYGYQIKQDLVKLNNANKIYNLSILGDKENFMYFCLNEQKYNPSDGELNILQPNGQLLAEINWLSSNFYNNIESFKLSENTPSKTGGNSPVSSFNKANFYNKYVYTQLAIWHYTNPGYFPMTSDVIKNNPEVVALINEADKHGNFYNPTYNQALKAINDIRYETTELVKESEDDDTYLFSTTITKSGSNELFDIKEVQYQVSLTENNQTRDITKNVTIRPATKNKVYIQVPKTILNESQAKLTVAATASISSDQAFTTYYDNNNNKQPVMSAYKLSKTLATEKSIDLNNQTHLTVYKKWVDSNNQDGKRPQSIAVQLYANEQVLGSPVTLNAENNWQYTWNELNTKTNGEEIEYHVKEVADPTPYTSTITTNENELSATITNTYSPEITQVAGEKIWNDQENQDGKRPASVIVNLLANGAEIKQQTVTPNQEGHWLYEFTNLPVYQDGQKIVYTVTEDTVPDYSTEVNGTTITNSYTPGKTSVAISKSWEDQNNQDNLRPNSIQVQLYGQTSQGKTAEGDVVVLNEENHWSNAWSDLPLMNQGETIKYTVEEVNQSTNLPGYTTTIDDSDHGNIILTNKHEVEVTKITGEKTWKDSNNQDGLRPDQLTVILYADGVEQGRQIVTAATNWTYEFNELPVYSKGQKIEYKIAEVAVPGYESGIDGWNLTNTHVPETTTVTGVKTWHDKDNQDGIRPDQLTVILYANGTEAARQTITAKNNWVYTFTDLPKNADGKEIEYTVEEIAVPGYEGTSDDINLLNAHQAETTKISGTKTWDDHDNNDGKRPESIIVYLYADGVLMKQQEVKPDSNGVWTYEFDGLAKNKDGKAITYTVREEQVPYYSTEVKENNLINHYTTEVTDVKGQKTWDDQEDQDGLRPKSITVHLIANGNQAEPVATKVVDQSTNWAYEFDGLPVYQAGKKITYTVVEDKVFNYMTTVNGYDITNTYTPKKTSATVVKKWVDDDNRAGKRPDKVTVQLYANGQKTGDEVTLNSQNNWRHTWADLEKKDKNGEIHYTVKETSQAAGYTAEITKEQDGTISVTNTYEKDAGSTSNSQTPSSTNYPKTGEQQNNWTMWVGLLFISSAILLLLVRRRYCN